MFFAIVVRFGGFEEGWIELSPLVTEVVTLRPSLDFSRSSFGLDKFSLSQVFWLGFTKFVSILLPGFKRGNVL